jgi:hypothetical protein
MNTSMMDTEMFEIQLTPFDWITLQEMARLNGYVDSDDHGDVAALLHAVAGDELGLHRITGRPKLRITSWTTPA